MLVVDQLQELNGTWSKVLDVMRYDVSVSPHCRVGGVLTSSSHAWTQWRMTRGMRARRRRAGTRWRRKRRATRRGSYDSWGRAGFWLGPWAGLLSHCAYGTWVARQLRRAGGPAGALVSNNDRDACNFLPKHAVVVPRASIKPSKNPSWGKI